MNTIRLHSKFQLNGSPYTINELKEHAYTLIKEGEPYESSIGDFLLDWLGSAPTIKVSTSGSTSSPKTIVIKKEHMVNSALATGSFFGLQACNTALHCLPTDFIAGKMMLVRAMVLGLSVSCVAPTSTPLVTGKKRYDFAAMVPLQLRNSLAHLDCIETLIVGGAPISDDLKQEVMQSPTKIFETYGMTETITHIAIKQVNHLDNARMDGLKDVFKTVPNVSLATDTRGCLVIEAPKVAEGLLITNDMVDLISQYEFRWLGRYDNVINSGGIKLIPEQIESKLSSIISQRFFVAGLPDKKLGQKLVIVVEGKMDKKEVRQLLNTAKGLSKYQIPKTVFVVPEFLETETGKIRRSKTLELLSQ